MQYYDMKSKKDYISMLNDLGNSLSREEWIMAVRIDILVGIIMGLC